MAVSDDSAKMMSAIDMLRGNVKALEEKNRSYADQQKQDAADYTNRLTKQQDTIAYLTKAFEKEVSESGREKTFYAAELKSNDQTIKRLERQIDLLTKEVAAVKKDALGAADLKPLLERIKKLEK